MLRIAQCLALLVFTATVAGCAKTTATEHAEPDLKQEGVEWTKSPDARTGLEVWQVTDADSASQASYYEGQSFTSDERFIVFSSRRTGRWQMYRADLESGEIVQLTDVDDLGANSFSMHPDGREVYYLDGWTLGRVDVPTARADTVIDFHGILDTPPRHTPLSFSRDGDYTAVGNMREDSVSVLTLVNVQDGSTRSVMEWPGKIGHLQISPADHNLISFAAPPDRQNDMTLPMSERTKVWIVDARTGEPRRFLAPPYGFRATHALWSPSGERFYFFQKTQPGWVPVSIVSMRRDGEDWQTHYTHSTLRLGHGDISSDEQWFVTDGQDPDNNPLILINLKTGASDTLCWPNASIEGGHNKQAHVHPSFSPKGTYIAFTSDRTGVPQVYVVPVPSSISDRLRSVSVN